MNAQKPNRPKVSINEHRQLVTLSKSKKLAAIANKISVDLAVQPTVTTKTEVSGLKSELDIALHQARQLIDARINDIMNSFPQGKRNSLFRFRYGSVEAIKSLEFTAAFKKLDIHAPHINMRVLKALNYHGDSV